MTLAMDPRDRTRMPQPTRLLSTPRRPFWLIGAGSLGLVAFTYGAFAFFGDLADPRARTPRPRMTAVTMPDLTRDGVPALAPTPAQPPVTRPPEPSAAVPLRSDREEAPDLSREASVPRETAGLRQSPVAREEPVPLRAAEPTTAPAPRRADKPVIAIENAAVVKPEVRQAAVIAPLRLSTPIAPAKAETVRAKLAEERPAATSPTPPSPTPTASSDTAAKRANAAKPPREKPVRAASADATPAVAAAPARPSPHKAEPEDDIGTKIGSNLTSGIKAIGGLLTGD